jgi:hypothetical protein
MDLIDKGIEEGSEVDKLIQLKVECQLLLTEVVSKIKEIESI